MDDFIRPVKQPEPKQKKKKVFFKEIAIIVGIIFCLGIGFVSGYLSKRDSTNVDENSDDAVLSEAYSILEKNWYNASDEEINLQSTAINGLVEGLSDIHSSYWTSDQKQSFNESVNGNYEGIGVGFSDVGSGALIVKVYDNSPASKVDLKVGDIIVKADGTALAGLTTDEVKALVRGEEGTIVTLDIARGAENFKVEVTRDSLSTAVEYEVRIENGKKFGYVEITTFGNDTAKEVETALQEFQKQGVGSLVLDLRDNGGGYLTAAVDILELFFKEGEVIYQMQEKNGPAIQTKANDNDTYEFNNGYILINGNTASASELVAGALQEELKYQLIGTTTYGKGTAQTQVDLSDGSTLKYTYAKWMTPSGNCVQGKGLTPDVEIANYDTSTITIEEIEEPLKYDQVDTKIASMQKMLNIIGYDCGRQDGYFSTQTQEALKSFESVRGVSVDGIYDHDNQLDLIGQTMIYGNDKANDEQYKKLLQVLK